MSTTGTHVVQMLAARWKNYYINAVTSEVSLKLGTCAKFHMDNPGKKYVYLPVTGQFHDSDMLQINSLILVFLKVGL